MANKLHCVFLKNRLFYLPVLFSFLLSGCADILLTDVKKPSESSPAEDPQTEEPQTEKPPAEEPYKPKKFSGQVNYAPQTDTGKLFKNMMEAEFRAWDDIANLLPLYYDDAYLKSVAVKDPLIPGYIPDWVDFDKERSYTDEKGFTFYFLFDEEVYLIYQNCAQEIEELKPDMTPLLDAGFTDNDGVLYLDDEEYIDTNTFYGIIDASMLIEAIKGYENGEDPEAIMDAISEELIYIDDAYYALLSGETPDKTQLNSKQTIQRNMVFQESAVDSVKSQPDFLQALLMGKSNTRSYINDSIQISKTFSRLKFD
ncbi:MAG: hypothetical protein LBC27_09350 [Spirochaetaceae bacterium]|jgi:hypothetical protein|nr:hypothetical protein [Spirochaetaceae bacterium]